MKETAGSSKNFTGKKVASIHTLSLKRLSVKKDLDKSKVFLLAPDQRVISGFQIRQVDLEQPIDHL